MTYTFFVVDDDYQYAQLLSYRLGKHEDYEVRVFDNGQDALDNLEDDPDVVVLDIMMPGMSGIEVLERIKKQRPNLPVVMISAQGAVNVAVEAMKKGAYDYITKGEDDLVKLDSVVEHIVEKVALSREVEHLRGEVVQQYGFDELIGESAPMESVQRLIRKALQSDISVAIQGESGTGKELVARIIHYNSVRRDGPFVAVNCAAVPRDLMESTFFGHEKGAFTGAHARKKGKFEQADGGTLFLDEISELDPELQPKLLRVLQEQEVVRVGGDETIHVDVRVICATNSNLREMLADGGFREDLYYRLFQFPIQLPPLRDREQDALLLAHHFMDEFYDKHEDIERKSLSSDARRAVLEYSWPGNVRELKNAVERAVLISDGEKIEPDNLIIERDSPIDPWSKRVEGKPEETAPLGASGQGNGKPQMEPDDIVPIQKLKERAVEQAYEVCDGNVDEAAVRLGIGRATMYRLLKKYEITDTE
jgi:DNA-binding NtrC family response regulator